MNEYLLGAGSALWLGVLTSVSPCPLATNIAAISFVGRKIGNARSVLLAGVLYTLGRMVAYGALGVLLVSSALSVPFLANFLQEHMNRALGPILILVSLPLLGVIRIDLSVFGGGGKLQERAERLGVAGAILLGVVFALSFCPLSAALFFGSLIPLAVKCESGMLLPSLYGIGTGLPVVVFSFLLVAGAQRLAAAFDVVTRVEVWARRVTGAVFLVVGTYYLLVHVFHVDLW